MSKVVDVKELTFSYGNKKVLKNLNLTIHQGEIVGLIGENGAGKTTLLHLLLGLLPTDRGIKIFGDKPGRRNACQRIGSMLQGDIVLANVTVTEMLYEAAAQYPKPKDVTELLQESGLQAQANQLLTNLSGGLQRRVTFALALVGNPALLFLDEPTVGMDAQARKMFWQQIQILRDLGKTIVITSHYLEEIQQTADRLFILQNGTFAFQGTFQELQNKYKRTIIHFRTKLTIKSFQKLAAVVAATQAEDWIDLTSDDGDATLRALVPFLPAISNLSIQRASLENIFLKMINKRGSLS
ncbi:ABC transporter ATP-binding protein [Liquorilactobacillus sicerae]|uniref:ABC transporter ATP-binding protein n=1 Tax=Liquorilactobacillus sicerae TaxID=1416943 RepID=UPI002480C5F4|nr:ABC transporter ATP-binding protein [Liquorilactobacillus sicerae]